MMIGLVQVVAADGAVHVKISGRSGGYTVLCTEVALGLLPEVGDKVAIAEVKASPGEHVVLTKLEA